MTAARTRRVALVTGAADRIGAHLADVLAADGYDLHLHTGHRAAELADTARRIHHMRGVEVTPHVVDLRSRTAVRAWLRGLHDNAPGLVVHSASSFPPPAAGAGSGLVWGAAGEAFAVHVLAGAALADALAGRGHVVNVLDARLPLLDGARPGYEVAKHALAALTLLQARRLAPDVRVNALAPGLVLPSGPGVDLQALAERRTVLARPATLDDLGAALLFLNRTESVTGQVLFVDAGEHLGPGLDTALSPEANQCAAIT